MNVKVILDSEYNAIWMMVMVMVHRVLRTDHGVL